MSLIYHHLVVYIIIIDHVINIHLIYCLFLISLLLNSTKLFIYLLVYGYVGFPGGSEVKVSAWNAGDPGLIPGSGRSPGEGNGNPLQYSCQENPMEGGAW